MLGADLQLRMCDQGRALLEQTAPGCCVAAENEQPGGVDRDCARPQARSELISVGLAIIGEHRLTLTPPAKREEPLDAVEPRADSIRTISQPLHERLGLLVHLERGLDPVFLLE